MNRNQRFEHIPCEAVRFDGFLFDLQTGELRRRNRIVALRPLATRCLTLLVKRAGRLVTMEELRQELWGTTVVSWSAGIHQAIRQIRRALGDDKHAMIETVTRRGYRFHQQVEQVTPEPISAAVVSGPRFRGLSVYATGFATPLVLVVIFFFVCGFLS